MNIRKIWETLEKEANSTGYAQQLKYKRLDLENELGVRLGYTLPDNFLEIMIQISGSEEHLENNYPQWRGMQFETVVLDIPKSNTKHIRLILTDREHKDVFITVCEDLIEKLQYCRSGEDRKVELELFIKRWTRFFERCGTDGLSQSHQVGLFGELWWLHKMISSSIDSMIAVESWRGCEKSYYDFEFGTKILEVKTTMTKEPRKVTINNERQLDDRGLESLHLFVLSLTRLNNDETITLPELIKDIRNIIDGSISGRIFDNKLVSAGYIDAYASLYINGYVVKKQELFKIKEGFPRIINMPEGTGNLKYSVTISACASYKKEITEYISEIR